MPIMRSLKLRVSVLAMLSPVILLACQGCWHRGDASTTPYVPVVPAARVVQTDLRNDVRLTAEFEPYYQVDVMAKEAGYIRHMLVDIGDHVKSGQLLAMLEIPELQADLTKAKSDVQVASSEKAVASGDLLRSQAALQIAHLSFTRIQDVSKKEPGLVPLQEVDVAHSKELEAQAQQASAEERVAAAESRYQSAVAELAHESALVKYTRITSPFEGVVTKRYASDGSMIQAGIASQTQAMPVVTVSQNNVLRLMLPVPEENVSTLRNGQNVSVEVPALKRTFEGTITRFADSLQMATRTMTAEVDVKNPTYTLVPGMYAEVRLDTAQALHAVVVPAGAVDGAGSDQKLFVVGSDGIVHARKVTTGLQSPQYLQVLSGAQPGEVVITGRHSDLQDGEHVSPLVSAPDATAAPVS